MDTTEAEKAYCAGVIDSDGCIRVAKQKAQDGKGNKYISYFEIVSVGQVEPEAVDLLKAKFGGTIYIRKRTKKEHKELYVWRIQNLAANRFLKAIHPYLRIKPRQAENCFEFRSIMDECKITSRAVKGQAGTLKRSDEFTARFEEAHNLSHFLNGNVKEEKPNGQQVFVQPSNPRS